MTENKKDFWKYVDFSDLISLHIEITRQSYDTHSKDYADRWEWSDDIVKITRRDYLKPFMDKTKKGGMVLVVGCGTGRDLKVLNEEGYSCLGVDNSKGMLEEAIHRNGIKSPLVCESIENINLAAESFDGILIDSALEHVRKADMSGVLLKLYSVLKKDGVCLIRFRIGTGQVFLVEDNVGKRYFTSYTEEESQQLVEGINFKLDKKFVTRHLESSRPGFLTYILRK